MLQGLWDKARLPASAQHLGRAADILGQRFDWEASDLF